MPPEEAQLRELKHRLKEPVSAMTADRCTDHLLEGLWTMCLSMYILEDRNDGLEMKFLRKVTQNGRYLLS